MFLEPIREPGTRFAIEHHGGKAGRFWGFEEVELDGMILFRPRMCPHCKREAVVFDQRDFPYCPACGREPFLAHQAQPARRSGPDIERYRRLKAQKRGRIIYK